jgi:hypothetical protein
MVIHQGRADIGADGASGKQHGGKGNEEFAHLATVVPVGFHLASQHCYGSLCRGASH